MTAATTTHAHLSGGNLEEEAEEEAYQQAQSDQLIIASYMNYISERLGDNFSKPPTARPGMKTVLRIQLIPTGQVVSVAVVKGSGNAAFDRAAERAVNKVRKFEKIKDMPSRLFERKFRRFSIIFDPED